MTQPLRVLLIDDNPSDRALILQELQREFSQLQVQEIVDAIDFEQAMVSDNFDAVVTDYQLRWSNGLEVLRTVKALYPQRPVVMFTSTGTEEIAVEALQSGLDDYVLKEPNRYIRVPAAIRLALDRVETQRQAILLNIRLRDLLSQLQIGIFRSRPNGTLIESNPAFLKILGAGSLAQVNELNLLNTHDCYIQLAGLPPFQRQVQELQLQQSDGTHFWALLTTTLNTIEGITVVDGLLEDITDRKETELVLQQLNATLEARATEQTAQLETANQDLEELAYSVSHDLRAPLRTIQGFAQILLEDIGESLNPEHLDYLQRIAASAEQLNILITDLLIYSGLRQGEIELKSIDLFLALTEVLTQLKPEIQARQARIRIRKPLLTVQANRLILTQVLTNLLSNAVKFVANGVQPEVRVWAEPRADRIRLWIEDNGVGIAVDKQEQIFKPFTRLHAEEEYSGTGIGLAIVRKGVEQMGGQVGVETQLGRGSRFWIELPRVLESP
ncbi:response regulator [Phormidium tenue FACHB-886]|nr:response regulator [Phormidium tenue FACHB-886]